jgi:hypothetical protein
MKTKLLLILSLAFNFNCIFSQDYALFQPQKMYHYERVVSDIQYIYSVYIDSVATEGSVTSYFHYKQVVLNPNDVLETQCLNRNSWFSSRINMDTQDGTFIITSDGRTITFMSQAALDEDWQMFVQSDNQRLRAKVTSIYTTELFDEEDEIKEITLFHVNADGEPITGAYNEKKILLSKSHGLVSTFGFLHFSYFNSSPTYYNLVGFEEKGFQPLKEDELYLFEVGDFVYYKNENNVIEVNKVLESTITPNSRTFVFETIKGGEYIPERTVTYEITPGRFYLTGQFSETTFESQQYVFRNYIKNDRKYFMGMNSSIFNENNQCWLSSPPEFSVYGQNFHVDYAEKLGHTLIKKADFASEPYYDYWGYVYSNYSETAYFFSEMVYYKSTDDEFGTYQHPLAGFSIQSKIHSCDGVIDFELHEDWISSITWEFPSGETYSEQFISHTFTEEGEYLVKAHVNYAFGDTVFEKTVYVGNYNLDFKFNSAFEFVSCNEYLFKDLTPVVEERTWTFPNGDEFDAADLNYTFSDTGWYSVNLNSKLGFCEGNKVFQVYIGATEFPIAPQCIASQSYGTDLYYFNFMGKYFTSLNSSPTLDKFMHGCNQFRACAGEQVSFTTQFLNYYLYEVDYNLWNPWYKEINYSLWIDSNNDGIFQEDEMLVHHESDWFGDYNPCCDSGYEFMIPVNTVRGVPLRMRLTSGTDPCSGQSYDFSMIVQGEIATVELVDDLLVSSNENVSYSWLNCQNNNLIDGEISSTFQPQENGSYALVINDGTCNDTSECHTYCGVTPVSVTQIDNTLISNNENVTFTWLNCQDGSLIENEVSSTFEPQENGSYALVIYDGLCYDTSACFTFSNLSFQNKDKNQVVNIYPNPTSGLLKVVFTSAGTKSRVIVHDLVGKQVAFIDEPEGNHLEVDMTKLAKGIYLVDVFIDNNLVKTEKVVKK